MQQYINDAQQRILASLRFSPATNCSACPERAGAELKARRQHGYATWRI
ncbi:MAG: hypothetical protein IPK65_12885 [Gammaproteobacteria bacterium]|nr:hypothetical protein [Gammaproteobacteria bacterium]